MPLLFASMCTKRFSKRGFPAQVSVCSWKEYLAASVQFVQSKYFLVSALPLAFWIATAIPPWLHVKIYIVTIQSSTIWAQLHNDNTALHSYMHILCESSCLFYYSNLHDCIFFDAPITISFSCWKILFWYPPPKKVLEKHYLFERKKTKQPWYFFVTPPVPLVVCRVNLRRGMMYCSGKLENA